MHLNSAHDTSGHARLLKGVLQGQSIHHRGQHAHIVCLRAIHTGGGTGHSAEDIASAYDDANLDAIVIDGFDLLSEVFKHG